MDTETQMSERFCSLRFRTDVNASFKTPEISIEKAAEIAPCRHLHSPIQLEK